MPLRPRALRRLPLQPRHPKPAVAVMWADWIRGCLRQLKPRQQLRRLQHPLLRRRPPDASTLASASVDPSSRGALPADQDEPDQAGAIENLIDTDGDGIGDAADLDDDGDGVPDAEDLFPGLNGVRRF